MLIFIWLVSGWYIEGKVLVKVEKMLSTFVDLEKMSMLIQFCKFITIITQVNVSLSLLLPK